MRTLLVVVLFPALVTATDHLMIVPTEQPAGVSSAFHKDLDSSSTPRPVFSSVASVPGGYVWSYSDGSQVNETFAEYTARTGKFLCTSGHCSHPAAAGTPAVGGCQCGCNAAACNCHHSPGVAKQGDGAAVGGASPFLPRLRPFYRLRAAGCASGNCAADTRRFAPLRRLFRR